MPMGLPSGIPKPVPYTHTPTQEVSLWHMTSRRRRES